MDFDKVNRASNLVSKSPNFRRNVKYNMQQEIAEQKYRDYELEKQNVARTNTLNSIKEIEKLARTYAFRDKDKARMQEIYGDAATEFKDVIASKYGGDITRFWYEGGQAELQRFRSTILDNEDSLRIKQNTEEFAKYFSAINKKGGMSNVFQSTARLASLYGEGKVDSFRMPVAGKIEHQEPDASVYNNARPGTSKVDVVLGHMDNEFTFRLNYANEKGLNIEDADNIPYEELRKYAAQYVGGLEGYNSVIRSKKPSYANTIAEVFNNNFNAIDGDKIIDTENRSSSYKEGAKRLAQLAQQSGGDIDAPVYGKIAFEDYLPEIINVFVDRSFKPGENFKEDSVYLEGKKVEHTTGNWFGGSGERLQEGAEFEGNDWSIVGVSLSYKTVGDEPRLLSKEEVESGSYKGKVVPTYVVNLADEGFFGGDEYISKELNFNNVLKSDAIDKLIDYNDSEYQMGLAKEEQYIEETPIDNFVDIDRQSSPSRLYEFALYNNKAIGEQIQKIGAEKTSLATKSTLLAFSQLYEIDINSLYQMFSLHNSPDLHKAIVSDDPQEFINSLSLLSQQNGQSKDDAEAIAKELASLAAAINNSIIEIQNK